MQSSTLGENRNSSSHQRTAGNQCTTAGCICRSAQAYASLVHVLACVCVYVYIQMCLYPCLSECFGVYMWVLSLAYFLICMYACVVSLPVCLSACACFNWRSLLADPVSHTQRQLERWIIWAISGPVSLWALLYIHCRHRRKERGFASTAFVPWLHILQTKHSLAHTASSGSTLHHSAIY